MSGHKQDPDNTHILKPEKDKHTKASGKNSVPITGIVCKTCGGRNGKHFQPCNKTN